MRKKHSAYISLIFDSILIVAALFWASYLRFDGNIPQNIRFNCIVFLPTFLSTQLLANLLLGCYDGIYKYAGVSELIRQFCAVSISGIFALILKKIGLLDLPGSIIVMHSILVFLSTSGVRGIWRFYGHFVSTFHLHKNDRKRLLIIGAGAAGAMAIKRFQDSQTEGYLPVCALDDDTSKQGFRICGVKVLGGTERVLEVCAKYDVQEILIAMPSTDLNILKDIYTKCAKAQLPIRFFQSPIEADDFMSNKKLTIQDVSIEDLLFRNVIKPHLSIAKSFIKGKVVMITGGAGSIGSELCRQVLDFGCERLIIFDIHENGLFELNEEFKNKYSTSKYNLILGSVRDADRLEEIFLRYNPQVVVHAAAHKHVPMMEINPVEAVKNNVFGTYNVIKMSKKYGVKKFTLISTDKAVNPTNVMGATKRVAELLVKMENSQACEMVSVRFGNVLGSNGSVIPIFKRQIAAGGPVTVTDPEMKRYFMTIPEAVSLVLTASATANGGELFVLDMGTPVKIVDLARDLITLSGFTPNKDIEIAFTGLRPGEKLFEELSLDSEEIDVTTHEKIFVMLNNSLDKERFHGEIEQLHKFIFEDGFHNDQAISAMIFSLIDEEKPVCITTY